MTRDPPFSDHRVGAARREQIRSGVTKGGYIRGCLGAKMRWRSDVGAASSANRKVVELNGIEASTS
jgi:hypothetical protein